MSVVIAFKKRFTPVVFAVLMDFIFWRHGVSLGGFARGLDTLGYEYCFTASYIAWFLVPVAVFYSFVRRFVLRKHQWDFYGLALSVMNVLLVSYESELMSQIKH